MADKKRDKRKDLNGRLTSVPSFQADIQADIRSSVFGAHHALADYELSYYLRGELVSQETIEQVASPAAALQEPLPSSGGAYDTIVWRRRRAVEPPATSAESLTLEARDPDAHGRVVARWNHRATPLHFHHDSE